MTVRELIDLLALVPADREVLFDGEDVSSPQVNPAFSYRPPSSHDGSPPRPDRLVVLISEGIDDIC